MPGKRHKSRWAALCLILAIGGRGGSAAGPEEVLERARSKLQAITHNLANYACIETVERRYYRPSRDPDPGVTPPAACSLLKDGNGLPAEGAPDSTDRLRLEVTVSEGREIYSWPGATRFDSRDVGEIIREGPIGTGSFGTHLQGVFDTPGVEFHFAGERAGQHGTVFEYRFHVPLATSHYRIKVGTSWQQMAYDGSFWLDPESLELQRLTIRSNEVPPETSICELDGALDYQRVHIGNTDTLLPSEGQLRIVLDNGRQTNNITTFANCREYQTESALSFDGGTEVKATARPVVHAPAIPIGLPLTLSLTTAIATDTAAAGDPVTARVVKDVRRPGSADNLIPAGATVRGRITRAEHHLFPSPYSLIAISFNRLVVNEVSLPFAARYEGNSELARELGVNLFGPGLGLGYWDVGTFLFPGKQSHQVMPAGFQSKWMTLATRAR